MSKYTPTINFDLLVKKAEAEGVDLTNVDTASAFLKANAAEFTMPSGFTPGLADNMKDFTESVGDRSSEGWLYQHGPFSLITDNILSMVTQGGSPLVQWLPTRLISNRFEPVSHLEFITPHGFDGSQTYRDWLSGITIADCDFGPTVDWSGFEFQMTGGEWSWQSPVLKEKDFGQRDYEKSPVYTVRGDKVGMIQLQDDATWGVAKALLGMEQHINYLYVYGDSRNNPKMEIDGLDVILTPGYVQSRRIGGGIPHYANPTVLNGAGLRTPGEIVAVVRALARKILNRIRMRQWGLNQGDMAIVMPFAFWTYIADELAKTGGYSGLALPTWAEYRAAKMDVQNSLAIEVDGQAIPVILDGTLGQNVTLNPGQANEAYGVLGDIYVLTRRVNGEALLEAQYMDWRAFDNPLFKSKKFSILGGVARAGWKSVNDECYQYYVKMGGRLVTRFQPLQARINNVVVETMLENENEAANFYSQDFYAYDGQRGGQGTSLLTVHR